MDEERMDIRIIWHTTVTRNSEYIENIFFLHEIQSEKSCNLALFENDLKPELGKQNKESTVQMYLNKQIKQAQQKPKQK